MIRALYSAASGMTAQQINVDNIANNLANANTAGYKVRARAVSGPALSEHGAAGHVGRPADRGADRPATRLGNAHVVERDHLHAGRLLADQQSARRGDPGPRLLPGPPAHRRDRLHARRVLSSRPRRQHGDLRRRSARSADHHSARRASPSPSPPTEPSATRSPARPRRSWPDRSSSRVFQNPAGLNSIGRNLYLPTDASGDAIVGNPGGQEGLGTLLQGYTEQSNVSVVDEFINLIVASAPTKPIRKW